MQPQRLPTRGPERRTASPRGLPGAVGAPPWPHWKLMGLLGKHDMLLSPTLGLTRRGAARMRDCLEGRSGIRSLRCSGGPEASLKNHRGRWPSAISEGPLAARSCSSEEACLFGLAEEAPARQP